MKSELIILLIAVYNGCEGTGLLTSIIRAPVDAHLLLHDGLNKIVDLIPPQIPGLREGARHFVNPHGEHGAAKRSIQGTRDRDLITTIARIPGDIHRGVHDGIGALLNILPNVPVITDLAKEYNDPTISGGGHGHSHGKRSIQGTKNRDLITTIARIPGDIHRGVHDGIGALLNVLPNVPVLTDLAQEYNDPTISAGGHHHGR